MTQAATLDLTKTVVLIMDFTKAIVEGYATDPKGVVERAAGVLAAARKAGVPVIHVVPTPRGDAAPASTIHPGVAPVPGEPVIAKARIGSFSTTGLDAMLRQMGRDTLVLLGVATSGCVLSTARWAADVNYKLVVVTDACSDPDPAAHRALTEREAYPKSFLGLWRLGTMMTAEEFSRAAV